MAFARWIMAPHVDSAAMLSAFLDWKATHETQWRNLGSVLTIVEHPREPPGQAAQDLSFLTHYPCASPGVCKRCLRQRPGYTFRWLGPQWADAYKSTKSSGSWSCTDPEGYPDPDSMPRGCSGQIVTSTGVCQAD